MQCLLCGTQMRVVEVARDDSMLVPGYEDQTLECPSCREIERRRVFRSSTELPAPEQSVPSAPAEDASQPVIASDTAPLEPSPEVLAPQLGEPAPGRVGLRPSSEALDGEELLRRAIAMVRAPIGSRPVRGLIDQPIKPTSRPPSSPPKKTNSGRIVQIRHDPSYEAAYVARDSKTGLVVLRHQDSARLRAMCERLGWQVREDGGE